MWRSWNSIWGKQGWHVTAKLYLSLSLPLILVAIPRAFHYLRVGVLWNSITRTGSVWVAWWLVLQPTSYSLCVQIHYTLVICDQSSYLGPLVHLEHAAACSYPWREYFDKNSPSATYFALTLCAYYNVSLSHCALIYKCLCRQQVGWR